MLPKIYKGGRGYIKAIFLGRAMIDFEGA